MEQVFTAWHLMAAAEAYAAVLFARCGWDVSVQYGASQPEYDLIAVRGDVLLKVPVKGSKNGSWGLTQGKLTLTNRESGQRGNYHGAIDAWPTKHSKRTLFCLVQFKDVALDQMPRIYLATPAYIAQRLKETANGHGDSILFDSHTWAANAYAARSVEQIPASWLFTPEHFTELFTTLAV